jgi:hypothetical protein
METDPSLRLRVTPAGSSKRDHPVMLSAAKHLEAQCERPFAAAQGDIVKRLRLMPIRADKSAPTVGGGWQRRDARSHVKDQLEQVESYANQQLEQAESYAYQD